MSACTSGTAVAVNAMIGTFGMRWRSVPSMRYSGRKSCPHSETQCASSMANLSLGSRLARSWLELLSKDGSSEKSSSFTLRSCRPIRSDAMQVSFPEMQHPGHPGVGPKRSTWAFVIITFILLVISFVFPGNPSSPHPAPIFLDGGN